MTSYSKQTWSDGPGGGTPISAARLNHMEDGVAAAAVLADMSNKATPTGAALNATSVTAVEDAIAAGRVPAGLSAAPGYASKLGSVYAALAARMITPVNIGIFGDSIVEGSGATTPGARWTSRFRDQLRTVYPTPGVPGGPGYITAYASVANAHAADVAIGAAAAVKGAVWGLAKRSWQVGPSTGAGVGIVQWPAYHAMTSFDLCWKPGATDSQIEVSTDGGTTYTAVPAPTTTGEQTHRVTIGAAATRVIRVRYVAGGPSDIEGIMGYNGDETSGVRVWSAGVSGTRAEQWTSGGQSEYWSIAVPRAALTVAFVCFLVNDTTLRTPQEYRSDIQKFIDLLRLSNASLPVVLAPPWKRQDGAALLAPWEDYVQALRDIAAADPLIVFYDVRARVPAAGVPAALLADGLHPNDRGHAYLADIASRVLTA